MDVFDLYDWSQRKLVFHGSAVEISCACEELVPQIDHLLHPFREAGFPDGFIPLRGVIEPYDLEDVLRNLSIKAKRLPTPEQASFELYRDGNRYFRLESGVGLTKVDLGTRRWHSWVTFDALNGDPVHAIDSILLWPLAQLLGQRDINLVPAVAVARDGFGVLLLGDLSLEPELSVLLADGYKIIGQRWVAMREENGRVSMMHLPGHVQRKPVPRAPQTAAMQSSGSPGVAIDPVQDRWLDLHAANPQSLQHHAFCDLILVCNGGRREQVRVKQVGWAGAMNVLRRAWPMVDLPPGRHSGKLVSKMAASVRVAEMQLSRNPAELIQVLDMLRGTSLPGHLAPVTLPAESKMLADLKKRRSYRPVKRSA